MAEQADLRKWLDAVSAMGELEKIDGAHWNIEIGGISEHNARQRGHRALLFDEIPDYPSGHRVLSCATGSPARLGHTFRLGDDHDDASIVEALRGKPAVWEATAARFPAQRVKDAPVLENCMDAGHIDLSRFVAPKWHEFDGGPYLGTGTAVMTRNPDTGIVNVGSYRGMLHEDGKLTLAMAAGHHGAMNRNRWWEKGERCPLVVSLGHDPLLMCLAGTEVPGGISELDYYGAICGEPLEVVHSDLTGLPIPAASEVAIEGFLEYGDFAAEGPFGEWRGYYNTHPKVPVVHIERVWYRSNPICLGAPPSMAPFDWSYFRVVFKSAMVYDALVSSGLPEVRRVWCHECGGGRSFVAVSIQQRYCGHSRQAGHLASQLPAAAYSGKFVVVVDEDVDATDIEQVLWAMCTRCDPAEDIDLIRKAWGSAGEPLCEDEQRTYNSRAIIDACIPFERRHDFMRVCRISPSLEATVVAKWGHLWSR